MSNLTKEINDNRNSVNFDCKENIEGFAVDPVHPVFK